MASGNGRLYRFFILSLLLGVFIELAALISIFREDSNPDGNIAIVELKEEIHDSKQVIKDLKKYEEAENVKAIVLRVDTPGGTVGASQEIHDEVERIAQKKKIIVSMGDVAASGGYYLSASATKIVANPGTITGSIGVIATYFVIDDLLKKLHLKWEVIAAGKMKDIGSPLRSLTAEEKTFMKALTDDMHAQFIEAVAKGRSLPLEKAKSLSDGRVYTGRQAKDLGLVDELGGLEYAVTLAGKLAGLQEKIDPIYPKEENDGFWHQIMGRTSFKQGLNVLYKLFP